MKKFKFLSVAALAVALVFSFSFAALNISTVGEILESKVPDVTVEMLTPEFWTAKTENASDVLMNGQQIEEFNEANEDNEEINSPIVSLANYQASFTREELTEMINDISSPSSYPRYDENCVQVTDAFYDERKPNLNIAGLGDVNPVRYGISVRRTNLRTFPTYDRIYRDCAEDPTRKWLDRWQETAVYPAEPMVILSTSTDGEWYFAQIYNYLAWIPVRDVAVAGTKEELFDYVGREPFLIVTGKYVSTNHNPMNEDVSELRLDMGTRIPLALTAELPEDGVDGQGTAGNYVVRLPARDETGGLVFSLGLIPINSDVNVGYLPYTRAGIIEQAFKVQGERYGWGGMFNGRDCSAFSMDVFRSMGLNIQRNSSEQGKKSVGIFHDFPDTMTSMDARRELVDTLKPGTVLYMSGHVMIYLGRQDGTQYIIHDHVSVSATMPDGTAGSYNSWQVDVTPLSDGLLEDLYGAREFLLEDAVPSPPDGNAPSDMSFYASNVPDVTVEMLTPEFWTAKTENASDVLMNGQQIEEFNEANEDNEEINSPIVSLANYQASFTREELTEMINDISSPSSYPRYDENCVQVTDAFYDERKPNLNIAGLGDVNPVRYGISVRRTNLRTFPTYDRIYRDCAEDPTRKWLDRWQETAVYPAEPMVILSTSTDGEWYFAQIYNYLAWIPVRDVAVAGTKEELFDYVGREPFLIVTGKYVSTNHNPMNEDVSELRLDMGTRIPLALTAELPEDGVDGQGTAGNYVVRLPARDETGGLVFSLGLIPINSDVNVGYLPYTRAGIIEQAFKVQGERYGWGGMFNGRDCSAFSMDVFRSMGLNIQRNSSEQGKKSVGIFHDFPDTMTSMDARRELVDTLKPGTVLYMSGHVMIYLGRQDGTQYIIHDHVGVSATMPDGSTGTYNSWQVDVTPLSDGLLEDLYGAREFVLEAAPTASFTASPENGDAPLEVSFDASGSTGDISAYSWNFGDGATDAGATVTHVFTSANDYTAILTVTGPAGSDSAEKTVTVDTLATPPTASFTASPESGDAPLEVSFDSSGSTGDISAYSWNFGDGATDAGATVTHVFTSANDYTAILTVTGPGGSDSAERTVAVSMPATAPTATFTASPENGDAPLEVSFDASGSTGDISAYSWDFGDGTAGTGATVTHEFTFAGDYPATLTVTGPGGSDSTERTIAVDTNPDSADNCFISTVAR